MNDNPLTLGEFVPPGHFYSAIPSIKTRQQYIASPPPMVEEIPGIDLNITEQLEIIDKLSVYHNDCPFVESAKQGLHYQFDNTQYSYADAYILYGMINHYKPLRIVEIGSGWSTCAMLDSVATIPEYNPQHVVIDPVPELIKEKQLDQNQHVRLIECCLQDVEEPLWNELHSGDLLFVDSTHVCKLGSDVNQLLTHWLPNLAKGVLIHFHDIFYPFEYPSDWISMGRAWNEAYMLRSFLQFNTSFEICLFSHYLHLYHSEKMSTKLPGYEKNSGGCIWLQRTK